MSRTHRVAIAQIRPAHLDLEASADHAVKAVREAASKGAELVVLGESVLPGYPAWIDYADGVGNWDHAPTQAVFARLRENSLTIPGATEQRFAALAKELEVCIVLGAHERPEQGPGYGTLYNVLLGWNSEGERILHHRKLVPTHTERLIWGPGDGAGLHSSATKVGRVGGLICWEHWMPLARQAMHDSGEDIHIAVWPAVNDTHQLLSRHYAMEGRCFVLAAGSIMAASDTPTELCSEKDVSGDELVLRGGSAIISPDGSYIAGPVFDTEEVIVADLDFGLLDKQRMALDVSGHYSRPDVLELIVNRNRSGKKG